MRGVPLWAFILVYFHVTLDQAESTLDSSLVKKLTAVCGKDGIKVIVRFYHPFTGIAYSDGHYDTPKCVFINHEPENVEGVHSNETKFSFLIPADECGTVFHDGKTTLTALQGKSDDEDETMIPSDTTPPPPANEVYMENTVMFQKNHFIQEQGDLAQKLRCVWQKEIRRPLQATLPLMGKQRPKHTYLHHHHHYQHNKNSHKLNKTEARDRVNYYHHQHHYTSPYSFNPNPGKGSADIGKKRFQPKGHVESVPYGSRSGKSIDLEKFPEIAYPHDESISFRSLYNLTALPFKAPEPSYRSGSSSLFGITNLSTAFRYFAGVFLISKVLL